MAKLPFGGSKKEEKSESVEFTGGIKIKDLILHCIKTYPVLISQNRISLGMDILDKILHLLSVTLSYGFWKITEIHELVQVLRSSISSFLKIETLVNEFGSDFTKAEIKEIVLSMKLCRRYTTVSLIQMILQFNDTMFVSQFSNVGKGFGIRKTDEEEIDEDELLPFFKNNHFIKDCSAILLNYLLKDQELLGFKVIGVIERSYLRKLVNLVF